MNRELRKEKTAAITAEILRLVSEGLSYSEIGARLKIGKSAVNGYVFRARNPTYSRIRRKVDRLPAELRHRTSERRYVEPKVASAPFEADSSCPDFAHDDEHCAAVLAHGGFPVLSTPVQRRAA